MKISKKIFVLIFVLTIICIGGLVISKNKFSLKANAESYINAFKKSYEVTFLGTVESVDNDNESLGILVKGYVRRENIYEDSIIGIVSNDTKLIIRNGDKEEIRKFNIDSDSIEKGDVVYIKFSPIMTMSLPPQSVVEEIQITKNR